MKRPRIRLMHLMMLVAIAGAVLYNLILLARYEPKDLLLSAFGHDTAYATSSSEGRFRGIRAGMTPAKVLEAMGGPPLRKMEYPDGFEYRGYSMSPRDTNHWKYSVYFRDGRVSGTYAGFYVD